MAVLNTESFECRKIPNFDWYYVTNNGDIFVCKPRGGYKLKKVPVFKARHGYYIVHLSTSRHRITKYVHRIVLESFKGPSPLGYEASHLDGRRDNNNLSNLEWESKNKNCSRRWDHGTQTVGEHAPSAKLSNELVVTIKRRINAGEVCSLIAKELGVHKGTISSIKRGDTWKHIQ